MTHFRTIGPGMFECLEEGCEFPTTANLAAHAISNHHTMEVRLDEPLPVPDAVAQVLELSEADVEVIENMAAAQITVEPARVDERPKVVYFRVKQFYGQYKDTPPKTHIHRGDHPGKYGTFSAYCGYERKNILGDLAISHTKRAPSRLSLCKKCLSDLRDPQES